MKTKTNYTHVIDAVFPIAVFFVFAASSLAVLLLAARIYSSTSSAADSHYTSRTAFAYVMEKVRQNDTNDGIGIETIEGATCLALHHGEDDSAYTTYIYADDDALKELRIREGVAPSLGAGTTIVAISRFNLTQIDDHLYQLTIISKDGENFSLMISERSAS